MTPSSTPATDPTNPPVNQPHSYATKGDSRLELTPKGNEQAREAGARLAELVGDKGVFVACSPFERAQQTLYSMFEGGFPRQQVGVLHYDPRIREQEFGAYLLCLLQQQQ